MTHLRALFSSNDPVGSSEAFTNRQDQRDLVATALEEHLRRVADPAFDVGDLEAPRDNVLVSTVSAASARRRCRASWRPRSPIPGTGPPSGAPRPGPASGSGPYASTSPAPPVPTSSRSSSRSGPRSPSSAVPCLPSIWRCAGTGSTSIPASLWRSTCGAVAWPPDSAGRCRSRCSPRCPTSPRPCSCPAPSARRSAR